MSISYCSISANSTRSFPALYIPRGLDQTGNYLCNTYDAWLFTVLWTLIIYAALYLAVAGYAFLIQTSVPIEKRASQEKPNTTLNPNEAPRSSSIIPDVLPDIKAVGGLIYEVRRNWKVGLVVGFGYVIVGGAEAVLAGSVVGAILGTVYQAGGYRLSTWVPLVWAVINAVLLVLSSFSIQERLL